jgi:hypothetical protein
LIFSVFLYGAKIGGILGVTKKTTLTAEKPTNLNVNTLTKQHLNSLLFWGIQESLEKESVRHCLAHQKPGIAKRLTRNEQRNNILTLEYIQ